MEETKCYCGHTTYCDCGPEQETLTYSDALKKEERIFNSTIMFKQETLEETFEKYLQRLKNRRTEDDYKYTDDDFIKYEKYIRNCWETNLSVYKCLEFMWFNTKEARNNFKKLNII